MSGLWVLPRRLLLQPSSSFWAFSSSSFSQRLRHPLVHRRQHHCRHPSLRGPHRLWACRRSVPRRLLVCCCCRPLYVVSGYNALRGAVQSIHFKLATSSATLAAILTVWIVQ